MNNQGQILLPGLVWFLALLALFFVTVTWGRHQLQQDRMETAAAAAALSSARALALQLNECATQNLEANGFINLSYKGYGAMQVSALQEFLNWLKLTQAEHAWEDAQSVLNGFKGNAAAVGSQVAKLNGAKKVKNRSSLSLRLQIHDAEIVLMHGLLPMPDLITFPNVYFKRQWGYSERKAQPPHQAIWAVSDGSIQATATAQVYLDVGPTTPLQNGGFPREQGEGAEGEFEIQSQYPQFNAKLVPASILNSLVNWVAL